MAGSGGFFWGKTTAHESTFNELDEIEMNIHDILRLNERESGDVLRYKKHYFIKYGKEAGSRFQ